MAAFTALTTHCALVSAQVASGPLTVHPISPRYVADAQGRGVYLTGSHTWASLQDIWTGSYSAFDAYLNVLAANGHNFIRLWRIEMPAARYAPADPMEYSSPHPWRRTGPGIAGDGGLKFNLTQFDQTCLADAGDAYLVYAPSGGMITVDLTAATGVLEVEWFNPDNGGDHTGGRRHWWRQPHLQPGFQR